MEDVSDLATLLASLAPDVLALVITTPAALLTALHLNASLRRTLADPEHDALWPLWASLVLRLCDVTASLALATSRTGAASIMTDAEVAASRVHDMYDRVEYRRLRLWHGVRVREYEIPNDLYQGPRAGFSYQQVGQNVPPPPVASGRYSIEAASSLASHAARSGSWTALCHALLATDCVICGSKTRSVAWAEGNGGRGPERCCASCSLPVGDLICLRAVVIHPSFFDAQPFASIDASAPGGAANLMTALRACPEGGTITLSGTCEFGWHNAFDTAGCAAVRILGIPPPVPLYTPLHPLLEFEDGAAGAADGPLLRGVCPQVKAPQLELYALEKAAAADVGCPGAAIISRSPFSVQCPLMMEGVHLSTGERYECGKLGYPHELGDPIGGGGAICDGVCVRGDSAPSAPLLLSRCWITAHSGTGLVLDSGAHALLSRCVVSNCVGAGVACNSGATLRMAGCHIIMNNLDISAGAEADFSAVAAENCFRANLPVPGTVDCWSFPIERDNIPPFDLMPMPSEEMIPWSPALTTGPPSAGMNEFAAQVNGPFVDRQPPAFARIVNVALLG